MTAFGWITVAIAAACTVIIGACIDGENRYLRARCAELERELRGQRRRL